MFSNNLEKKESKKNLFKMPNHKSLSFPSEVFSGEVFCALFLFVISSCSREDRSSTTLPSKPDTGLNPGSETQVPSKATSSSPIGKPVHAATKLEGPDGDMDGDGILNSKDPDPLVPNKNSPSRNHAQNKKLLEGPDGDMDGDGIPNSKDPKPLEK